MSMHSDFDPPTSEALHWNLAYQDTTEEYGECWVVEIELPPIRLWCNWLPDVILLLACVPELYHGQHDDNHPQQQVQPAQDPQR